MVTEDADVLDAPLGPDVGDCSEAAPGLLVEVWLGVPTPAGWQVLMLRRSQARGGFWQGVSGRVEPDDDSLRHAALREIDEELGLDDGIELSDLGTWYEFQSAFSGRWFRKRSLAARLPAGATPTGITLSEEHVEARLVPFEQARALVRWEENVAELHALEARLSQDQSPMRRSE